MIFRRLDELQVILDDLKVRIKDPGGTPDEIERVSVQREIHIREAANLLADLFEIELPDEVERPRGRMVAAFPNRRPHQTRPVTGWQTHRRIRGTMTGNGAKRRLSGRQRCQLRDLSLGRHHRAFDIRR